MTPPSVSDLYRIGLIEWMENTCTLKEFLAAAMTEEESLRAARYTSAIRFCFHDDL